MFYLFFIYFHLIISFMIYKEIVIYQLHFQKFIIFQIVFFRVNHSFFHFEFKYLG
jgi:hypothetical protein